MKRILTITMIVLALLLGAACENVTSTRDAAPRDTDNVIDTASAEIPTAEPADETAGGTKADVTVADLYAGLTSRVQFPSEMIIMEDDYFVNQFGFDLSEIEEYVYAASENALLAENIIIIKVKDAADTVRVKAKLDEYVSEQITVLNSYLPDQGKVAEASVVDVRGDVVYLLMSSKVDELNEIMTEALR